MILSIKTSQRIEFVDISGQLQELLRANAQEPGRWPDDGVIMVYCPHTTAGVTINEAADPSVARDIVSALNRMVPESAAYSHHEGNSPAHIKASLVGSSQVIPVENRRMLLGTWQGVFFCEFDGPRTRKLLVSFLPCAQK